MVAIPVVSTMVLLAQTPGGGGLVTAESEGSAGDETVSP